MGASATMESPATHNFLESTMLQCAELSGTELGFVLLEEIMALFFPSPVTPVLSPM